MSTHWHLCPLESNLTDVEALDDWVNKDLSHCAVYLDLSCNIECKAFFVFSCGIRAEDFDIEELWFCLSKISNADSFMHIKFDCFIWLSCIMSLSNNCGISTVILCDFSQVFSDDSGHGCVIKVSMEEIFSRHFDE